MTASPGWNPRRPQASDSMRTIQPFTTPGRSPITPLERWVQRPVPRRRGPDQPLAPVYEDPAYIRAQNIRVEWDAQIAAARSNYTLTDAARSRLLHGHWKARGDILTSLRLDRALAVGYRLQYLRGLIPDLIAALGGELPPGHASEGPKGAEPS